MVGESWDVFTKRVLVEKHISCMMCKNQEGGASPLPTHTSGYTIDDQEKATALKESSY